MAEKTVTVRLKAVTDTYKKAMADAGKATGDVATKAEAFKNLGRATADLGGHLTRNVTMPILAVGAGMAVMATNFDNVFAQMRSTAGVADEEIEGLKDSVLELSKATGRGPQELAEALLLIRSSGFAGAEALDVLEMSAKGASAGMGQTRELANALTNVIAGYGKANISAAEAMDVLTASVQEGKAEASEMAPQFGRLVPIAAELDVEFSDVAGALAYLTRASGDAAQSSTALQGILSKLLKPSQQGEEALKGIGESARSLRSMIDEKGLLGTLTDLRKRLGDTGFNILFDDVQALNGALQLTGAGVKDAQAVIDAVTDSTGKADEAFGKWAESMGAKNSIAFAKFQAGMIELGDQIAPTAASIIGFIGDMVEVFADLPEPVQKAIVVFAALAAAAGPALTVGGNLIKVYANVSSIMAKAGGATGMASGIAATATGFAILAPLMIGAGIALQDYVDTKADAKRVTDDLVDALKREAAGMEGVADKTIAAELATGDLGTKLRDADADFGVLGTAIRDAGDEIEGLDNWREDTEGFHRAIEAAAESGTALGDELKRLKENGFSTGELSELIDRLDGLSDRMDDASEKMKNQEAAAEGLGDEQAITAEKTELLTEALNAQLDALRAQYDPFFALQAAMAGVRDAQAGWEDSIAGVTEAQKALDDATKVHGANSAEAAEAARRLADAEAGVEDAQWAASEATVNLVAAGEELRRKLEEQGLSADAVRDQLYDWAIGVGFSREEALRMASGVDTLTGKLKKIPPITTATISVKGREQSISDIAAIQAHINALRGRDVGIRVVGTSVGAVLPGGARVMAKGGRLRAGEGAFVGEEGVEWFQPDQDGTIVPHHALGNMTSPSTFGGVGGGGGQPAKVVIDITGGDDHFLTWLRKRVRIEGGDVQVVLGQRQ